MYGYGSYNEQYYNDGIDYDPVASFDETGIVKPAEEDHEE